MASWKRATSRRISASVGAPLAAARLTLAGWLRLGLGDDDAAGAALVLVRAALLEAVVPGDAWPATGCTTCGRARGTGAADVVVGWRLATVLARCSVTLEPHPASTSTAIVVAAGALIEPTVANGDELRGASRPGFRRACSVIQTGRPVRPSRPRLLGSPPGSHSAYST